MQAYLFAGMLQKTEGIVLRSIKYSETSVVIHVYTRRFGLLSFIVPGVRSSNVKRNKAGILQPMNMLDLDIYHKETQNLLRLKDYRSNYIYQSMPFDMYKASVGFFYTDVLIHVIKEQEPNEALFLFIIHEYLRLDQTTSALALLPHRFLLRLSSMLGFLPDNNYSDNANIFDMNEGVFTSTPQRLMSGMPQDISFIFHQFISDPDFAHGFSHDQRKQLLGQMLEYFKHHVANFGDLKSVKVLEEVLR